MSTLTEFIASGHGIGSIIPDNHRNVLENYHPKGIKNGSKYKLETVLTSNKKQIKFKINYGASGWSKQQTIFFEKLRFDLGGNNDSLISKQNFPSFPNNSYEQLETRITKVHDENNDLTLIQEEIKWIYNSRDIFYTYWFWLPK